MKKNINYSNFKLFILLTVNIEIIFKKLQFTISILVIIFKNIFLGIFNMIRH
jgi:hypothetical protein